MFGALWLLVSYLFYRRYTINYHRPNFFGEEGYVFAKNIIDHGTLRAMTTTFNGYYIWGLYLVEKLAFMVNAVFYHGEFVNLPRSFALVSFGSLGFLAILPLLLLRKIVKIPVLLFTILLTLYVPLLGWDYGVIGTLGNLKFAFIYIAFLLLIYRHYLPEGSRKFYLVDLLLLICAYTNVTVYVMLPFALLRYTPKLRRKDLWHSTKTLLLTDRSLQSLIVLGVALLPQLYIVKRDGIPPMPGYLDQPYEPKRTVEIFVSRSYLHEILFAVYKHLNDTMVVIYMTLFTALGIWMSGRYRKIFLLGYYTIFVTTFLFTLKRTGVSRFYVGYHDAGPDQFFFIQNWIFGFLFAIVVVEIISRLRQRGVRVGIYLALAFAFLGFLAPRSGTFGKNAFEDTLVGNVYKVAQQECATDKQVFDLPIYPTPPLVYQGVTRQQLCTPSAINYHP